ncbi:MAG: GNAT family N-acetyltransferase [Thermoplasmatales archaeon]|nr:GNAT family N-acetyltransferase [Thermoplasmatales archaeon]
MPEYKKYVFETTPSKKIQISENFYISTINNLKNFKTFYKVPWKIYNNNKYWVPPFWTEFKNFFKSKNIFWKHSESCLFIAYKNNSAIGRIAAIIDHSLVNPKNIKIGFFGFFECIDEKKVALELLKAAEEWLTSKEATHMQGPTNARVDMGSGFLVKGFDSIPSLIAYLNPPYYEDFVKDFGMKKCREHVSYHINLQKEIPASVQKTSEQCQAEGIKIRKFKRWKSKKELNWFVDLLIEEFSDHWGYSSVPREEVKTRFGLKELKWIVDPALFLIAEIDNEPIGFRWSLPDYNLLFKDLNGKLGIIGILKILFKRGSIYRGRFIIMGIKKKYRGRGIGTCMNYHTLIEMKKRGYKSAEYGWIDEENIASRKAGEKIGGELSKIYRVFEKKL